MSTLCLGCMRPKENRPICEHCSFDERTDNLPHQLPIGTMLQNQYLVGRVLGQGGFGITYIGWDQNLSAPVAIKEYFPSGVVQRNTQWSTNVMCVNGEAPELFAKHRERFLKEARTLAQLSGIPEIVQVKSFFSANDTAYIVMEYVEGITLKQHLKQLGRPMTEGEALAIMEPVLRGLQKVHENHLIHRDISPDNIMLPKSGGVKLIDFGTVRYMDESGNSKSTESVLKPGFAPMEQYNARGNLGTWTDVYALCATFHYLLSGRLPDDVHDRINGDESLPVLRNNKNLSPQLIATLEHGMKIRIPARIQSVQELYNFLYSKKQHTNDSKIANKNTKNKSQALRVGIIVASLVALLSTIGIISTPEKQSAAISSIPTETKPSPNAIVIPESNEQKYEQGLEMMNSGSYDEAIRIFESLGNYQDCAQKIAECHNWILYEEAEELSLQGEYGKSAIAYAKLDGFQDAREKSFELWDQVPYCNTIGFWTADNGTSMLIALRKDGTLTFDTQKDILFNEDLAQHFTSDYRDLVAIEGIIALRYDGTLAFPSRYPQLQEWDNIVQISASYTNSGNLISCVGLRTDGTIVAIGNNIHGECNVENWTDIIAVATGGSHTIGLKSDGTVVATGYNADGRCNVADWSNIQSISTDNMHSYGVTKTHQLVTTGSQQNGQGLYRKLSDRNDIAVLVDGYYAITLDRNVICEPGYWTNYVNTWTNIVDMIGLGSTTVGLTGDGTLIFAGQDSDEFKNARSWTDLKIPYIP